MAGTRLSGPTISSTLSSTAPLFGVALGVAALGEALTLPVVAGASGVVLGVACLSWTGEVGRAWPMWALLLPIGAARLRTLAQMFVKIGMESIPSPFFVGLAGNTVPLPSRPWSPGEGSGEAPRRSGPPDPDGWRSPACATAFAIVALNTALQCGQLAVVSPVVACSPPFSLLLGWLVFRERVIDRRVVLVVTLVVPGVALIAVEA